MYNIKIYITHILYNTVFYMSLPPVRYTHKRSRAGKHIDELKLPTCEIREIKNDVEFSDLFGQLLEKRSNYKKTNFRVI